MLRILPRLLIGRQYTTPKLSFHKEIRKGRTHLLVILNVHLDRKMGKEGENGIKYRSRWSFNVLLVHVLYWAFVNASKGRHEYDECQGSSIEPCMWDEKYQTESDILDVTEDDFRQEQLPSGSTESYVSTHKKRRSRKQRYYCLMQLSIGRAFIICAKREDAHI